MRGVGAARRFSACSNDAAVAPSAEIISQDAVQRPSRQSLALLGDRVLAGAVLSQPRASRVPGGLATTNERWGQCHCTGRPPHQKGSWSCPPGGGGLCSVGPQSMSHQSCDSEMLTQTRGYTPLKPSPPRPGCPERPLKFHASSSPEAPRETITGQKLYPG